MLTIFRGDKTNTSKEVILHIIKDLSATAIYGGRCELSGTEVEEDHSEEDEGEVDGFAAEVFLFED